MWPIIGHQWAIELLDHGIQTHKLSHAYLFVGPNQVGKRTLGKALAQAILCTEDQAPCGTCRSCQLIERGRHPDVQVVASDGDRIKIEAIREMQHLVALSPVEGPYRIILIPDFDRATTSAANALLKTLEEPPSTVVLVLTATNVEALLPTIVSRCQIVPLRLLPGAEIRAALISRGIPGPTILPRYSCCSARPSNPITATERKSMPPALPALTLLPARDKPCMTVVNAGCEGASPASICTMPNCSSASSSRSADNSG